MPTLTGISTNNEFLSGVKTIYKGSVPEIYNSTKYYLVKQYIDEQVKNAWYYEYLFKATNLGAIGGDENLNFLPEDEVTISEFLKILIELADISEEQINEAVSKQESHMPALIKEHWAKKYICYGVEKNIITIENVTGDNTPDTFVPRCDAAYMINRMFIDETNQPNLRIPSNLYKYDENVSCERNTRWKAGIAFKDQGEILYCKDEIGQLYLNGAMDGTDTGYINWNEKLNRAEASKLIVKCKFVLDEGLEKEK